MTRDRGFALVITVMATALLSALGLALALVTSTEMLIAANYASAHELLYAAEGGLEIAEQELRRVPDWNAVLTGAIQSTWIERSSPIVEEATNVNDPRWQLFASGPLNGSYVVAWVSDIAADDLRA